jgi:hypothetical protein
VQLHDYLFLLEVLLERDDFRLGTFAPFFRASLRPIAIACLRLLTFCPEPLFNVPFFRRRIVDFTLLDAELPYLAIASSAQLRATFHCRSISHAR